jgi:hypothetical protein
MYFYLDVGLHAAENGMEMAWQFSRWSHTFKILLIQPNLSIPYHGRSGRAFRATYFYVHFYTFYLFSINLCYLTSFFCHAARLCRAFENEWMPNTSHRPTTVSCSHAYVYYVTLRFQLLTRTCINDTLWLKGAKILYCFPISWLTWSKMTNGFKFSFKGNWFRKGFFFAFSHLFCFLFSRNAIPTCTILSFLHETILVSGMVWLCVYWISPIITIWCLFSTNNYSLAYCYE